MERIFLLIGSNLGDVKAHIDQALNALVQYDIKIVKKSAAVKTAPWGKEDQPEFLNMAVEVACDHSPQDLLCVLKKIEQELGRTAGERWGARIIDLDILFYDRQIVKQDDLVIPHPRFFDRPFAIALMAEIAPHFVPPGSDMSIAGYYQDTLHERKTIHCS